MKATFWRRLWLCVWALCGAWLLIASNSTWAQTVACTPHILATQAAPSTDGARPAQGWVDVSLPDVWAQRWSQHEGSVWYRIDWEQGCAVQRGAQREPVALGLDGISMAGEVFINDELLWRDASLVEPLSRSWNQPRWWLLPASSLHEGINTVWVHVVGIAALSPGLGVLRLGPQAEVEAVQARNVWRQHTVYVFSAGLSTAVGCLFGIVWCLRRTERAYGWHTLMALAWTAYLFTMLGATPGPWIGTVTLARLNIAFFVLYAACFCVFSWRFGAQVMPRLEHALWVLSLAAIAAVMLVPYTLVAATMAIVWIGFALLVFANCLQFQWHAWRPRPEGRDPQHMLLALCWLVIVVVGVHDVVVVLNNWQAHETWSALASVAGTVFMALLLGGRLVANMRRIERFNHELKDSVAHAQAQLSQVLAREHAQALQHAKLQERMLLAHDLHDGLGGSLVRSMALVEHAPQPLGNARMLSMLKVLRDDLRQIIDAGSSSGAEVPATPVAWLAPLRHRVTRILDELQVPVQWQVDAQWQQAPSAAQCLGLLRFLEEACANILKHSQARHVQVVCHQTPQGLLCLTVQDDGVGFDVKAVQHAALSVGMRSMQARVERMGAHLQMQSRPGATVLQVQLQVRAASPHSVLQAVQSD